MIGVRGTEGVLRVQNPTLAYCLSGILSVKNPSTGEALELELMRKALVTKDRPIVVETITPAEVKELMGEFEMGSRSTGQPPQRDDSRRQEPGEGREGNRWGRHGKSLCGVRPILRPACRSWTAWTQLFIKKWPSLSRGEPEASRWIRDNCPSETCDAFGRCFEVSTSDVIRRFTDREQTRSEEVTTRTQDSTCGTPGAGSRRYLDGERDPEGSSQPPHEHRPPKDDRKPPPPGGSSRPPEGGHTPSCPGGVAVRPSRRPR